MSCCCRHASNIKAHDEDGLPIHSIQTGGHIQAWLDQVCATVPRGCMWHGPGRKLESAELRHHEARAQGFARDGDCSSLLIELEFLRSLTTAVPTGAEAGSSQASAARQGSDTPTSDVRGCVHCFGWGSTAHHAVHLVSYLVLSFSLDLVCVAFGPARKV